MSAFKTIILAAGEGTRMKSQTPKVLHKVLDKPMIHYIIEAVFAVGSTSTCVVVGHQGDQVKDSLSGMNCQFAHQQKQLGTGHAVIAAGDFLLGDEPVLVLCGDTPLITTSTLEAFIIAHQQNGNAASCITTHLIDPTGYGRIIRDADNGFMQIVEHKDASAQQKAITEINTGIYCFKAKELRKALSSLDNNNSQGEFYLTDVLSILKNSGELVDCMAFDDFLEFEGVNNRVQLAAITNVMRMRINQRHMMAGVTFVDPANTLVGADVTIGADTIIYPGNVLEGASEIGSGCTLMPGNHITNTVIGDCCTIESSVIINARVGSNTTVGPFAYIRPDSVIGSRARIGDFVEIKNSAIGDDTKVSHLTYIGDCDAGSGINFGCGTVVVNYDGEKKHRTAIEDGAFIGCNTNLIAPVTIKKGAYTAAGSTITVDVQENALAVARSKQKNILDWVSKRRQGPKK